MTNDGKSGQPLVEIQALHKTYGEADNRLIVLQDVDLTIREGEFFVLLGSSGSGKSTLLNLISGIDYPDSGAVTIKGTTITALSERDRTLFRRDHIGIVFQFFNLIPTLTVLENITLPHELRGMSLRESRKLGLAMLERVRLADRAGDFPDKLSGGQQQRVAIARALIHEPMLVLADEPTGNLDAVTGQTVMDLLLMLTRDAGKTLVIATHDPAIMPLADRMCHVRQGGLHFEPDTHEMQPV